MAVALLLGPATSGPAHAQLAHVQEVTSGQAVDPAVMSLLERMQVRVLDPSRYPWASALSRKTTDLLQRLVLAKDGAEPIHFVIADDMTVNASYLRGRNGERIVVINLGLYRFLRSDDELAFVLGHELEHGTSQIEDFLRSRGSATSDLDLAREFLGKKAIENEVDVRSTVDRVHRIGLNPDHARIFVNRLREVYGDTSDESHSYTSSRGNTLEAALTGMSRVQGEEMKDGASSHDIVSSELASRFLEPAFRDGRAAVIQQTLKTPLQGIRELYEEVRNGSMTAAELEVIGSPFQREADRRWATIHAEGSELYDQGELFNLHLEMYEELETQWQAARKAALGETFEPPTLRQYSELRRLDTHRYDTEIRVASHYNSLYNAGQRVAAYSRRLREAQADLKKALTREAKLDAESRVTSHEARLAKAKQDFAHIRSAFGPGRGIENAMHRMEHARDTTVGGGSNTQAHREAAADAYASLNHVGRFVHPLRARQQKLAQGVLALLPQAFDTSENPGQLAELFDDLPKSGQIDVHLEALRTFVAMAEKRAAATSDPETRKRIFETTLDFAWRLGSKDTPEIRSQVYDARTNETAEAYRGLFSFLIRQAPNLQALHLLCVGQGEDTPPPLEFSEGGIAWVEKFAGEVFTPDLQRSFLERRVALIAKEIQSASTPEALTSSLKEIGDLGRFVEAMKRIGALPQRNPGEPDPGDVAVLRNLGEALRRSLGGRISLPVAEDLAALRYPDFAPARNPKQALVMLDRIQADATELLRSGPPPAELESLFDFEQTYRLGLQAGLRQKTIFERMGTFLPLLGDNTKTRLKTDFEVKQMLHARNAFAQWVIRNRPEQSGAGFKILHNTQNSRSTYDRHDRLELDLVRDRFNRVLKEVNTFSGRDDMTRAFTQIIKEFAPHDIHREVAWIAAKSWGDSARADIILSYQAAMQRLKPERDARYDGANALMRLESNGTISFDKEINRKQLSTEQRIGIFTIDCLREEPSPAWDREFEVVFELARNDPKLARYFDREEIVGSLFFERNQKILAKWQLERKFGLREAQEQLRTRIVKPPKPGVVRPEIPEILAMVDRQFPTASLVKDGVIEDLERGLRTNKAENELAWTHRLNSENWVEAPELVAIDLPLEISNNLRSNYDRLSLVEFLVGIRESIPSALIKVESHHEARQLTGSSSYVADTLRSLKRHFARAPIYSRVAMLQPLLDTQTGILSEPKIAERLRTRILGSKATDPVFRAVFEAYMESVPEAQLKLILGYILASREPGGSGEVSVRKVLEAMGPFGIKAGQFLRTSGLVGPKIARELDGFLDSALPPSRPKIIQDLAKAFRVNPDSIQFVHDLAGSGSINYVVEAELTLPGEAVPRRVVVRIRREKIEGVIRNENTVWERAIQKLKAAKIPGVDRLARVVEEGRRASMETLKPGGVELDLSVERANEAFARVAYEAPASPETGYRVEAARVIGDLQALIAPEWRTAASVYEHVSGTSLKNIADPVLRRNLARQIVEAELDALFRRGVFDPDGHPGNGLIDDKTTRLVRIDYAQLRKPPEDGSGRDRWFQDIEAFRGLLGSLLTPTIEPESARRIAADFDHLFEIKEGTAPPSPAAIEEAVLQALTRRSLPSATSPHERIFAIREGVEEALRARGHTGIEVRLKDLPRAGLSSLGRIAGFRENMRSRDFVAALNKHVEFDPRRLVIPAMRDKLAQAARTARRELKEKGFQARAAFGLCFQKQVRERILRTKFKAKELLEFDF